MFSSAGPLFVCLGSRLSWLERVGRDASCFLLPPLLTVGWLLATQALTLKQSDPHRCGLGGE